MIFEKPSETCQVLFGWNVVSVFTPIEKLLKYSGGTVSGKPAGPDGLMPRVPTPVTKPRSESFAKLDLGLSVVVAVRKKLNRNWFTAVAPNVLLLLMTNCCVREGVSLANPGTLAFRAFRTVELSQ